MKTQISGLNETAGSTLTPHLMIRTILLACGILASLVWLGTDIFASSRYAGYNYPYQPISGLSAIGAPTRPFVIQLLTIYIVLKFTFAVGIWISPGHKRALRVTAGLLFAFGVIDLASYFFPWHPADAVGTLANTMHTILAGVVTVLLILMTIGFGASVDGKWFRFYSYGTLLVLTLIGALSFLGAPQNASKMISQTLGVGERINAYGYMLWMMVLAIVLLSIQPKSWRHENGETLVDPEEAAGRE